MAIASALPSLLTATAAPAVPWLSLNVTIVDNDRGASPSSYRARALGAGAQEVPPGTVHVIKQCFSVKMWPCQASFWSRWHDPVLGRWLGLTPEQPAHFLRGFPECPRAAPSRVGDPPGLRVGVGEPRGRLGGLYAKNVTICPTQACTTPTAGAVARQDTADPRDQRGRRGGAVVSPTRHTTKPNHLYRSRLWSQLAPLSWPHQLHLALSSGAVRDQACPPDPCATSAACS